jgi:hypothetical protein
MKDQLENACEAVDAGEVNYVSFHAIDRAGKYNVLQTLHFYDKGVVVKIDNLGLESMINSKANPVFNLITTILSELSSLEKISLLERQKRLHKPSFVVSITELKTLMNQMNRS